MDSGDPLQHTPSSFPSASVQLPYTLTHIGVHGERTLGTPSTSYLIDMFDTIDTISTYGAAVGAMLGALSRTRGVLEGEKSRAEKCLLCSVQTPLIHDYRSGGRSLYPALHEIYNSIEPVKIFFKNALPKTREN